MARTLADDLFGFSTRKKGINSKKKGEIGERQACKLFTAWTGKRFNRVPASGGLNWKEDNRISGDIVAPLTFDFPFTVEVKNYNKLGLSSESVEDLNVIKIMKFWSQSMKDAAKVSKIPLLVVKDNGNKFHLAVDYKIDLGYKPKAHIFLLKTPDTKINLYDFEFIIGNMSFIDFKKCFVKSD